MRIRDCLTKAERATYHIHELCDSLALVRLPPNLRFISSRKVTAILLWCRGGLSVPVFMTMKTRRNGQTITVFECQRCGGTANRRGACDHERDSERHGDAARDSELHSAIHDDATCIGRADGDLDQDRGFGAVNAPELAEEDRDNSSLSGAETDGGFANSSAARAAGYTWSDDQEQYKNTLRHSAYVSRSRRSPFPCASDFIASAHMRSCVDESHPGTVALPELMDNRAKCFGRKENNSLCLYMSINVSLEAKFATRAMLLHGFTSRHLHVFVRDWVCPKCCNVVRYDGFDDGLFSNSSTHLWSRTAMDAFLAGSMRFSASGRATAGICAELDRARSYGDRLEEADARLSETPGRRQKSDASAAYLALLGDPQGRPGAMGHVFRCDRGCEGADRPRIVIGDGTAAGIFKDLPVMTGRRIFLHRCQQCCPLGSSCCMQKGNERLLDFCVGTRSREKPPLRVTRRTIWKP